MALAEALEMDAELDIALQLRDGLLVESSHQRKLEVKS